MSWGKWILGGLGFVLGGPIGAIIGVVIAGLFDYGMRALPGSDIFGKDIFGNEGEQQEGQPYDRQYQEQGNPYDREYQEQGNPYGSGREERERNERNTRSGQGNPYESRQENRGYNRNTRATQGDIRVSILVLIACVMKADGHVKKQELDVVKSYLKQHYTDEEARQALHILKGLLQQNIDHVKVSQQIRVNVNYSTRLEILHFLLDLAHADGEYASQEEYLIEQISNNLGLSNADYRSLLAMYGKKHDPNWAYKALEIDPSATNEEVKKAYRRMAMKYHPDKVASAGDDVRQKATEKFRAINEAYEYIKTLRGMK